jgi:hypothetical protein
MEYFRLTLFNNVTLLLMVLTALMALARFRGDLRTNWALGYYAIVLGYALGFKHGLNLRLVLAGSACALLTRFTAWGRRVRWVELAVLAGIGWRCLGLILLW